MSRNLNIFLFTFFSYPKYSKVSALLYFIFQFMQMLETSAYQLLNKMKYFLSPISFHSQNMCCQSEHSRSCFIRSQLFYTMYITESWTCGLLCYQSSQRQGDKFKVRALTHIPYPPGKAILCGLSLSFLFFLQNLFLLESERERA